MSEDFWNNSGSESAEAEDTKEVGGVEDQDDATALESEKTEDTNSEEETQETPEETITRLTKERDEAIERQKQHERYNSSLGPVIKQITKDITDLKAGNTLARREASANMKLNNDLATLAASKDSFADPTDYDKKVAEVKQRHADELADLGYSQYSATHVQAVTGILEAAGIPTTGDKVNTAVVELYNDMKRTGEARGRMEKFYGQVATIISQMSKTSPKEEPKVDTSKEESKQNLARVNAKGPSGGGSPSSDTAFIAKYGDPDYNPTPEDHVRAWKIRQKRDNPN